jgi:hypothetical protein
MEVPLQEALFPAHRGEYPLRARKAKSPISLKMEGSCSPKFRAFLESHDVISQKICVIVTAVKTSQKTVFFKHKKVEDSHFFLSPGLELPV